jgi:hypothetical protein
MPYVGIEVRIRDGVVQNSINALVINVEGLMVILSYL